MQALLGVWHFVWQTLSASQHPAWQVPPSKPSEVITALNLGEDRGSEKLCERRSRENARDGGQKGEGRGKETINNVGKGGERRTKG